MWFSENERGDQRSFGTFPSLTIRTRGISVWSLPSALSRFGAFLETLKAIHFRSRLPYFIMRNIAILSVIALLVSSYSKTTIETFTASLEKALMCSITNICNNFFCLDMGSLENGTDAEKLNCEMRALQWIGQQHISLYRRCYSCDMQHTLSFHCQDPVYFQLFRPV